MRELQIAACGLNHPQWEGGYYPEGLPPEWRLDFYANRFAALLLPVAEWQGDELDGWLEALRDGYPLYLQVDASVTWPSLKRAIDRLGGHFAGAVLDEGVDATPLSARGLLWGRVGGAGPLAVSRVVGEVEAMELRRELEKLAGGEGAALLWVDGLPGDAPPLLTLERAQTLASLMGL